MSYQIVISGASDSAEDEAKALAAAADLAETLGADGAFAFSGEHLNIASSAPENAVARARAVVSEYNLSADSDDKV